MLTNTDLTLYSKSVSNHQEVWTRNVIENVHWEARKAANQASTGIIEANKFTVWIPTYGRENTLELLDIKEGDVIVEGICTKEISASYTIKDLKAEFGDVGVIKSIDWKKFGSPQMQHIEIGAT
jgi:hypothetical protein